MAHEPVPTPAQLIVLRRASTPLVRVSEFMLAGGGSVTMRSVAACVRRGWLHEERVSCGMPGRPSTRWYYLTDAGWEVVRREGVKGAAALARAGAGGAMADPAAASREPRRARGRAVPVRR